MHYNRDRTLRDKLVPGIRNPLGHTAGSKRERRERCTSITREVSSDCGLLSRVDARRIEALLQTASDALRRPYPLRCERALRCPCLVLRVHPGQQQQLHESPRNTGFFGLFYRNVDFPPFESSVSLLVPNKLTQNYQPHNLYIFLQFPPSSIVSV